MVEGAAAVAFNKNVLASAGSLFTTAVAGLRKLKASWVSAPCSCPAVLRGSLLAQGWPVKRSLVMETSYHYTIRHSSPWPRVAVKPLKWGLCD